MCTQRMGIPGRMKGFVMTPWVQERSGPRGGCDLSKYQSAASISLEQGPREAALSP